MRSSAPSGRKLVFDGFMKVAGVSSEDQLLPELAEGKAGFADRDSTRRSISRSRRRDSPKRALVKELEQLGIGRPSTYASIIQTIQDREYVEQIDRRFHATMLGIDRHRQTDPGVSRDHGREVHGRDGRQAGRDRGDSISTGSSCSRIFTARSTKRWTARWTRSSTPAGSPSPYTCDKCGKPMVYRISKNGFFLTCSGIPNATASSRSTSRASRRCRRRANSSARTAAAR